MHAHQPLTALALRQMVLRIGKGPGWNTRSRLCRLGFDQPLDLL
jgi:hypothetical protein